METKLIFGLSSSIAAMYSPILVREFVKKGFHVQTLMTPNARRFVSPKLLEDLTGRKCSVDFDSEIGTEHISIARFATTALIAPASANLIAKLALGICDNLLLTELLAFEGQIFIAPAMNPSMYRHPTQVHYREMLVKRGVRIIEPTSGEMICGELGVGKMASVETIIQAVCGPQEETIFKGKKCLVSLGATRAYIDPVRFMSNESSGKMGLAIVEELKHLGANVTVIACNTNVIAESIIVKSNDDYDQALEKFFPQTQYFFSVAAVSDFQSKGDIQQKLPKSELGLGLSLGIDYLQKYGSQKISNQKIIAFAADTDNFEESGKKKLKNKNADAIFINPIDPKNSVFGSDLNQGTLLFSEGDSTSSKSFKLEKSSKAAIAKKILSLMNDQWKS